MSVVPLHPDSALTRLPEDLRRATESGGVINVMRVLLGSPQIATHVLRLGAAQFAVGALSGVDRELAILACGRAFSAPYVMQQHLPISRALGVTDEQRAAVAGGAFDGGPFSASQSALLHFVDAVATRPTVTADVLGRLRTHYDDRQLVEVIVTVGYFFLIGRLTTILNIPIDVPEDEAVLRAALAVKPN